MTEPSTAVDPVVDAARKRIKEIQIARRFATKKMLHQRTRRLPPAGPATRYFMAQPLNGIPAFEEVTFEAAEWHKAGTLMNLLQRLYVVAIPEVELTTAGKPPAVPEALKPCPTVDEIAAGLMRESGLARGVVIGLASRIHQLEHAGFVRRVSPYGERSDAALLARTAGIRAKLTREVEALMDNRKKPVLSEPVLVEKTGETEVPPPGNAIQEPGSDLPPAEYVTAEAQPGVTAPVTETLVEPAAPSKPPKGSKPGKKS